MEEKLKEMLDAVGALAEELAFFRDQLIDNHFDDEEALILCRELMRITLGRANGGQD